MTIEKWYRGIYIRIIAGLPGFIISASSGRASVNERYIKHGGLVDPYDMLDAAMDYIDERPLL